MSIFALWNHFYFNLGDCFNWTISGTSRGALLNEGWGWYRLTERPKRIVTYGGGEEKKRSGRRESVKGRDLGKCFRNNRIRWTWAELGMYFCVEKMMKVRVALVDLNVYLRTINTTKADSTSADPLKSRDLICINFAFINWLSLKYYDREKFCVKEISMTWRKSSYTETGTFVAN